MVGFLHTLCGDSAMTIRGQAVGSKPVSTRSKPIVGGKPRGMTKRELDRFCRELQLEALEAAEPLEVVVMDDQPDRDELGDYVGLLELASSLVAGTTVPDEPGDYVPLLDMLD